MQNGLRDLLEKRRNRVLAAILGVKERECDQYLPSQTQAALRKAVLDHVNEYHQVVMDVLDSILENDPQVILNDLYLQKIDSMYEGLSRLVSTMDP